MLHFYLLLDKSTLLYFRIYVKGYNIYDMFLLTGMFPLNGVLGKAVDDNMVVYYGLDMEEGDILEEGTQVVGHCYVW